MSDANCVWADPIESHVPYSEGTVAHGSLWSSVPEKTSQLAGDGRCWGTGSFLVQRAMPRGSLLVLVLVLGISVIS